MTNEKFTTSDLPIGPDGRIYHLGLLPAELAKDIIIVGDPGRASLIAKEFFSEVEIEKYNRGLRTVTGKVKDTNQRVSIITSGMGTPSLEIVLNEIVILNEIDFETRKRKKKFDNIHIIRVGTSGGLQEDTKLGTPIITKYSVGLDNSGLFVDVPLADDNCKAFEKKIKDIIDKSALDSRFKGKIFPYVAKADTQVVDALENAAKNFNINYKLGITASNSGFFAHQGRDVTRLPLTIPNVDGVLSKLDFDGLKIENMEMEASFLLHFMNGLGYKAGCVCPAINNRRKDTFLDAYEDSIKSATKIALHALNLLRN